MRKYQPTLHPLLTPARVAWVTGFPIEVVEALFELNLLPVTTVDGEGVVPAPAFVDWLEKLVRA
ncbi:MAG: hypothetical protein AB7F65_03570 [Dehalococcoidia bacterium]